MVNLMFTSNWLNEKMKEVFKPYDITSQQYNVLRILKGKYPHPSAAGDIKSVMLDKTPDLTRLVDRLLKKELVHRETCEHNRRKVDIIITENGMKLLDLIQIEIGDDINILHNITQDEAELLSDILDKIRN